VWVVLIRKHVTGGHSRYDAQEAPVIGGALEGQASAIRLQLLVVWLWPVFLFEPKMA
jgi:hypothetical protein